MTEVKNRIALSLSEIDLTEQDACLTRSILFLLYTVLRLKEEDKTAALLLLLGTVTRIHRYVDEKNEFDEELKKKKGDSYGTESKDAA